MSTLIETPKLSTDAKLRDLNLIDFQVSHETPCENVVRRLEDDNNLCGVVVTGDDGGIVGMLTRRAILEWMLSRPYGLDVFLNRPINSMIEFHQRDYILVQGSSTVVEAAQHAFQRPEETIYDPVVVDLGNNDYRLLDMPILLVAQAQVHLATQRKIEEQQEKMKSVLVALEKEKNRSLKYAQDLERQKSEILAQNLALEVERQAAQARSDELAQLNARILDISALLSEKGKSTFAATFEGVEKVRNLAEEIARSSQDLSSELREINTIADLIVEVAGYIRLLSFNAAVEANRSSGGTVGGFGAIAQEIRKLAGRTTEASSRIRGLADRIQRKSNNTVVAAQSSAEVVQSLSEQAQIAQEALDQLQSLLDNTQAQV